MKFKSDIEVQAGLRDSSGAAGSSGQILSSTGSGVSWINQISLSGYVPYTGATTNLNMGNFYVSASEYKFLDPAYSVYGRLFLDAEEFTFMTTPTSTVAAITYGQLLLQTPSIYSATITYTTLTDNRTYALPNASGTLALTSSVPSVSGTTNYVSKFTGTTTLGNSLIYDNGTNVGIGTTSPGALLDVNGSIYSRSGSILSNNFGGYSGSDVNLTTNTSGGANLIFKTSLNERMRIDSSGYVGIGTSSPFTKLHVTSNESGNWTSTIQNTSSLGHTVYSGYNNGTLRYGVYIDGGGGDSSSYDLLVGSGKFVVKGDGKVGIGTTSPTYTFEVNGTSNITNSLYVGGNVGVGTTMPTSMLHLYKTSFPVLTIGSGMITANMGIDTSNSILNIGTETNHSFKFSTNNTERMRIDTSGNVGIGTTSPVFRLQVDRNGTGTIAAFSNQNDADLNINLTSGVSLITPSTGTLAFGTSSTERMRITSTGNVGIGTSTPSGKLDTYGDGYFGKQDYSYQAIQKVLTLRGDPISGVYAQNSYRFYTTPGALNSAQKLSIRSEYAGSESSDLMTILGNGNVGIGTSSPANLFTVRGNGNNMASLQYNNDAGGLGLGFLNSSGTELFSIGGGRFQRQDELSISRQGTSVIYINNSNNVGIGTTTPLYKTHIQTANQTFGLVVTTNANDAETGFYVQPDHTNSIVKLHASGGTDKAFGFLTGNTERMRIAASGNVGIGTTSPSEKLEVNGNIGLAKTGETFIYNTQNATDSISIGGASYVSFKTYGGGFTEKMRINSSGNVGIGTSSPATLLNVSGGDFRLNGSNSNSKIEIYNNYSSGAVGISMFNTTNISVIDFNANVGSGTFVGTVTAAAFIPVSDIRLKDLINFNYNVESIKPITYTWKNSEDKRKKIGYSAQEIQKVLPEVVNKDDKGMLSVDYNQIFVAKINMLENMIQELKLEIEELKKLINK